MINLTIYDSYNKGKRALENQMFNFYECEEYKKLTEENKSILNKMILEFNSGCMKMSLLEGTRQSGVTTILRAFSLYVSSKVEFSKYSNVYYVSEITKFGKDFVDEIYNKYGFKIINRRVDDEETIRLLLSLNSDIIVFDLFTIFDFEDYIKHIDDTRSIIVIGTTYMNMEKKTMI